ncbi:MAG: hypothetical protein IT385_25025 [Deltaproteobacteria bacterium]|nr:hypothetical protein [Deltaproteobacteria bacterium]
MVRALVAAALLIGCGDDGGAGSDAAGDTITTTSDAATSETAAEVAPEVAVDVATDVAPEVLPLPGLDDALIVTPGEGLGDVRVQPALAWGPPGPRPGASSVGRLVAAWTGAADEELARRPGEAGLPASIGIFVGAWDVDGEGLHEVTAPELAHVSLVGIRNEPALCALAGGGFVVAWSADAPRDDGTNLHVAWRLLDAAGAPLGASESEHVSDRAGNHWLAEVACRPSVHGAADGGGFVLAGVRPGPVADMGFEVFVQPFDAAGAADGPVIVAFPRDQGGQAFPVVGVAGQGNLRVAWEDTPEPDARTVIATRAFVAGAGGFTPRDRVELVAGASGDAAAPLLVVHPVSGHALAGGVLGARLRLALDVGAGYDPMALPEEASAVTTVSAAAPAGDDGFVLVYYRGTGASVDVRRATIAGGVMSAATTIATGSFPLAYRPAVSERPDAGAIAWTESLGSGRFAVRVALYHP